MVNTTRTIIGTVKKLALREETETLAADDSRRRAWVKKLALREETETIFYRYRVCKFRLVKKLALREETETRLGLIARPWGVKKLALREETETIKERVVNTAIDVKKLALREETETSTEAA